MAHLEPRPERNHAWSILVPDLGALPPWPAQREVTPFVVDVAHPCYTTDMSTTTVRLDDEDEAILDMLAPEFGGRSSAIRQALRNLAADRKRQNALRLFLAEWDTEDGPIDSDDIAAMADRYGL